MESIHRGRLTWNLQITHLERKMIFQTSMIIFHVDLPGCTSLHTEHQEIELVHQSTLPGTLAVENHRIRNLAWQDPIGMPREWNCDTKKKRIRQRKMRLQLCSNKTYQKVHPPSRFHESICKCRINYSQLTVCSSKQQSYDQTIEHFISFDETPEASARIKMGEEYITCRCSAVF